MKLVTVFGTRPEIIRLSQVIRRLDQFCEQHTLIYTGQNYDPSLSDVFFQELGVRRPDVSLGVQATSFAEQVAQILSRAGEALAQSRPARLLILGDTNSGLVAIVAAHLGIPVYHMEAGNRCYDDRVPEEVNRRVIDHCSTVLLPYTHRAKENLLREGIERDRIFVTGNPIYEVLETFAPRIQASDALTRLRVAAQSYFLVTMHRSENVDDRTRLSQLLVGLSKVADQYQLPMLVSVHPRTASRLEQFGLAPTSSAVRLLKPLGFFDFVKLEKNARLVLSDSGTVQEECAIFRVPNVTIRDVTERPETVECGSNILSGGRPEEMLRAVGVALAGSADWRPPDEYTTGHVASAVSKIVLGYMSVRRHGPDP